MDAISFTTACTRSAHRSSQNLLDYAGDGKRAERHGGESQDKLRRRQIQNVFGVNVTDLVRDDGEDFFLIQSFEKPRMQNDDRFINAARKSVDDRI